MGSEGSSQNVGPAAWHFLKHHLLKASAPVLHDHGTPAGVFLLPTDLPLIVSPALGYHMFLIPESIAGPNPHPSPAPGN